MMLRQSCELPPGKRAAMPCGEVSRVDRTRHGFSKISFRKFDCTIDAMTCFDSLNVFQQHFNTVGDMPKRQ
jgi:hypothetical protein